MRIVGYIRESIFYKKNNIQFRISSTDAMCTTTE